MPKWYKSETKSAEIEDYHSQMIMIHTFSVRNIFLSCDCGVGNGGLAATADVAPCFGVSLFVVGLDRH